MRPSPGADVAAASPVPVQMWQGFPSPGADVAAASPVPAQMWQRASAVPAQMWQRWPGSRCSSGGRGDLPTALHEAGHLEKRRAAQDGEHACI
jgi:hypothetical protein